MKGKLRRMVSDIIYYLINEKKKSATEIFASFRLLLDDKLYHLAPSFLNKSDFLKLQKK